MGGTGKGWALKWMVLDCCFSPCPFSDALMKAWVIGNQENCGVIDWY
jgi:hypothetical protein